MREPPVKKRTLCCARTHTFLTPEVQRFRGLIVRIARMNEHLINIYNATGLNQVEDSINISTGGSPDLLLGDLLVISRVLFAVVMVGFIGYFFDRLKQSVFVKSEEKIQDSKRQ
jgi:hypothetical protein